MPSFAPMTNRDALVVSVIKSNVRVTVGMLAWTSVTHSSRLFCRGLYSVKDLRRNGEALQVNVVHGVIKACDEPESHTE